jgi:hypothetical protein
MNDDEMDGDVIDTILEQYADYESYLDAHMSEEDLFYLEDKELARQLIEVGYHGKSEILTREQFINRKKAIDEAKKNKEANQPKALSHAGCKFADSPFLKALAEREELVRNGRMTTIIFIRDNTNCKNEISGYIDLAHRLKTDDFKLYFEGKKVMLPRQTDLSYYNWETQNCSLLESPNFRVDANSEAGLLFRNKRDRKVINVDPSKDPPGDGTKRVEI